MRQQPASFAELLKQHRAAAGLTQEELAERAGLSARAISDLERGIRHRPYPHTVRRLVQALALDEGAATRFRMAAASLVGTGDERGNQSERERRQLPIPPTPFIGWRQEVEEVRTLLGREEVRLLTLTGPGGVGKTRLALRVAEEVASHFADGVVFISLASLGDPGLVPGTIARALGVREGGGQPIVEALLESLRAKQFLLVLDNFEHLLPAAEVVSQLLASCPQLTMLVTSRAVLHLAAEHEYPVAPLPVPVSGHLPDLETLGRYDAIQLFLRRARAVRPGVQLTRENAPAIAEICSRLDGLPLAIELAAVRIRVFPPRALLERLAHRLQFLTGGPRDLPGRQQTLRNTIDWSYGLLTPDERRFFARLSVFAGGFSFEAAEAVCNQDAGLDLLTRLATLVDKSLLRQEGEEEPRFSMLETIRGYAREKLDERGEKKSIQAAHARYFLALVEEPETELHRRGHMVRLETEYDNLQAALRWAEENKETRLGLRLVAGLWGVWTARGHFSEGLGWIEEMLSRSGDDNSSELTCLRAKALYAKGWLAWAREEDSQTPFKQCLSLWREVGDRGGMAKALSSLSRVAHVQGEFTRARELAEESLVLARELGRPAQMAMSLFHLGLAIGGQGDYAVGTDLLQQSLALARGRGDTPTAALALYYLGELAHQQGEYLQGSVWLEQSLGLMDPEDKQSRVWVLLALAEGAYVERDTARMTSLCRESLMLFRDMRHRGGVASSLSMLALAACREGDLERAVALLEEGLDPARWTSLVSSAHVLGGLAFLAHERGDTGRAEACLAEIGAMAGSYGNRQLYSEALLGMAGVAGALGRRDRAAMLLGAANTLQASIGMAFPYALHALYERSKAVARLELGEVRFMAAWEDGRAMSLEQALALHP